MARRPPRVPGIRLPTDSPYYPRPPRSAPRRRPGGKSPDSPNFQPGFDPAVPAHRVGKFGYAPRLARKPAPRPNEARPGRSIVVAKPKAGSGGKAVAGTLPTHAKTGARKSTSLNDATPAAKARAAARSGGARGGPAYGDGYGSTVTTGYPPVDPRAYVDAMLAPGYQQIDTQEARYRAQEAQRQATLGQFTAALISQLQGEPAKAAADYDTALAQSNALATQSADALRQANQNPQVQADLAAVGAPEAQKGQVAAKMGDVFGGGAGVLQHLGGTVPGQFLAEEKANRLGYLRTLPFAAGAEGQRALRQALWQEGQQMQGFEDQRGQLAARAPELYQQAVSQAQAQEAAARDFELKRQAIEINRAIAQTTLGAKLQNQKFMQGATTARLKLQALQGDRQWLATMQRLGLMDKSLQLRAAMAQAKLSASANNGGFTQPQRVSLRRQAGKIADQAFNGTPTSQIDNDPSSPTYGKTVPFMQHYSYQEAMRQMLSAGIPLTMAQAALNSFWTRPGMHRPGEPPGQGRPLVPYQLRQRTRRRR